MRTFSPRYLSGYGGTIMAFGDAVVSERGLTIEVQGESFVVENPRDRVATERWRKMNVAFAITEALSFLVGDDKVAPLAQFAPNIANFSTGGRVIDGAYGPRIWTGDQLELVINMLKKNPMTRRAVISIYMGVVDLNGGGGLNTPCTLNLHFLVRDGKLNMHVNMRSNDVVLGLTNDLFSFTFLQEYISVRTGIPLGRYFHHANSMHVYESDFEKFRRAPMFDTWLHVMDPMPFDFDPRTVYAAISNISSMAAKECIALKFNSQYETDLFCSAAAIYHRKTFEATQIAMRIKDKTLFHVVDHWLS